MPTPQEFTATTNGPWSDCNVPFDGTSICTAIARKLTSALHSTAFVGRACCMLRRIHSRDVRGYIRKIRFNLNCSFLVEM